MYQQAMGNQLNLSSKSNEVLQNRRIMKDEVITSNQTSRLTRNQQSSNRVIYKCQKQRNFYIRREVGDLIKKQLKIFFATEKLEKQIQDKNKDTIFTTVQTPIQKVNQFRNKQREKQWEKLKAFKIKNTERMKKLEERLKQKSLNHLSKSSQNFCRMSKVHKKFQENLFQQNKKIEELKQHLMIDSPRPGLKLSQSRTLEDSKLNKRVNTAKQMALQKQQNQINMYLKKMKTLQERRIKNEMKLQTKKTQNIKKVPKHTLANRLKNEQNLVKKWTAEYQKKFENFQKAYKILQQQKFKAIREKSIQKVQIKNQIVQRKLELEQKMGQRRVQMMQEKIMKINRVPGRNSNQDLKSKTSYFYNSKRSKEDGEKQEHNTIMRDIYHIIEKLKKLNDSQQLKKSQIELLIKNLDPNENPQDYKELYSYLNSTKEKFFEQKRKQEQERLKKNKKINQKML